LEFSSLLQIFIEVIFASNAALLISLNLLIIFGLYKLNKKLNFKKLDSQNKISVVIAAKNESENIEQTLLSLVKQNYPAELYEIIVVDDNSTDNTVEITQKIAKSHNDCNIKVFLAKEKKYSGKKGAIDLGVKLSSYDIIATTDADCSLEPDWLKTISNLINNNDLIFGFAPFYEEDNFFNSFYRFEHLKNSILTFSLCKVGLPYSCAARSLTYRKSLYYEVGGFDRAAKTLSGDDDLLLQLAAIYNKKIDCFITKNSFSYSKAPKDFKSYLIQKRRHISASFHYTVKSKLILSLWHICNLLALITPVFLSSIFRIEQLSLILALPTLKFTLDLITAKYFSAIVEKRISLSNFLLFEIIYELFIVANFFNSLNKNVKWKQ